MLALVKSVSVGLWALVTLGDMAAVLHVVWHSAREGDDGEGGTHKVLVLLEWAVVRERALVTLMTWQLYCMLCGIQRVTWGDGGHYSPGLCTCHWWAVAVVDSVRHELCFE